MSQYAFICGSNGPVSSSPLRFADTDAAAIATALAHPRWGYQVKCADVGASASRVRDQLYDAADKCTESDTFICYFAGHGLLNRGHLYFLLEQSDIGRMLSTCLPASDFTHALSRCRAAQKLLLLDCCHAEAATGMVTGLRGPTNVPMEEYVTPDEAYVLLFASGRLESAREDLQFGGGFFTQSICRALGPDFRDASASGRLTVAELEAWLTKKGRTRSGVSVPRSFGARQGDFGLRAAPAKFPLFSMTWTEGSELVLIPRQDRRPSNGRLSAVAVDLVTNAQYRKFATETGRAAPTGKHFLEANGRRRWVGPFCPWDDERFAGPTQPVVCVDHADAVAYCEWANRQCVQGYTCLPDLSLRQDVELHMYPDHAARALAIQKAHQRSNATARVDRTEGTPREILHDVFGNVWEWGEMVDNQSALFALFARFDRSNQRDEPERYAHVWGGGFLDDLTHLDTPRRSTEMEDDLQTKHSDLGFRIAARVKESALPEQVREAIYSWAS